MPRKHAEGTSRQDAPLVRKLYKTHDLLSWDEAAIYLGPSFTTRWLKRQVYEFKSIQSKRLGGRRVIPRSELDRIVAEGSDA